MSQPKKDSKIKIADGEEEYTPFSVILGRDLIFMDWTVQFGGQLLGIIVGGLLGFLFGVNVFKSLFSSTEAIPAKAYIVFQLGIGLAVLGLSLFFIYRMGIKINAPRKISGNKINVIKIAFFGFSFIFGMSYLYNNHLSPAVNRIAGIQTPIENGGSNGENGGTSEAGTVDFRTTNEYIILLMVIFLSAAIFALLYAGIIYSINNKVKTIPGAAIGSATILLMFYLLSQASFGQYLLGAFQDGNYSLILVFLTDLFYYLMVSLVTILVYHASRRIELSILVLFFGFMFGYGESYNIVIQIITLKWGFPNLTDNITTNSDIVARTLQGLELAGLFGMIIYPIFFYKDTVKFAKGFWRTAKKQGLALLLFALVVFIIELLVQWVSQLLGIFLFLIVFIVLIGLINRIISSRYGKQSYRALLTAMTQATLQMSEAIIPETDKQIRFLEENQKRRQRLLITLGTWIPLVIYFLVMYVTTAITSQTTTGTIVFLVTALPLSIGFISFAVSFYLVKDPLIKNHFNYPIKAVGFTGGIVYFFYSFYGLVYNEPGYYPLIAILFTPLIILPLITKRKMGTLLLTISGENKPKALRELIQRKDLDFKQLEENFFQSPALFRIWLALILTKRGEKATTVQNLMSMLTSGFPLERAAGALCLLYLNDEETMERIVKVLENDNDPRVRDAIAHGVRFYQDISEETYKRIIDSQHYEDDAKVLETLKQTISILDLRFSGTEEEVGEEEVDLEEI
ncbi:MAG: HEAT repeat domain-containing protein [Candidatus Heimdallarchaeota archaeon]|nr:HEAT repeat domain-containing protein [Candidatus Heimdallarchaeota archaeon]MCK4769113.1 HEAT repeat domain-containing protein [Candidatus Heimdallarchaeota archaeon]